MIVVGVESSTAHTRSSSRPRAHRTGQVGRIDALAVARAVVKDGVEQFPIAYLNEQAMQIRLLLDHREDLVAERTRTVRRPAMKVIPRVQIHQYNDPEILEFFNGYGVEFDSSVITCLSSAVARGM